MKMYELCRKYLALKHSPPPSPRKGHYAPSSNDLQLRP